MLIHVNLDHRVLKKTKMLIIISNLTNVIRGLENKKFSNISFWEYIIVIRESMGKRMPIIKSRNLLEEIK
jgi:hypothetical protein